MSENIALVLASRQKRLSYWLERFKAETLPDEARSELTRLLASYAETIRLAAAADVDRSESLARLEELDRELSSLFESRRLLTSKIGIAALTDYSTRGKGGSIAE